MELEGWKVVSIEGWDSWMVVSLYRWVVEMVIGHKWVKVMEMVTHYYE